MSNLIKFSLLFIITCLLFFSCEKDPFTIKPPNKLNDAQRQELWNKFSPTEYNNVLSKEITPRTDESIYPTQSLLMHIASELQRADSTSAFLEDMVTAFGLPLWNYSIIKGSESSDCVVSIPFDRITTDTSISGILKYYKFDDVEEFMFVPKTEIDSLVQTTLDTVAYDGYIRGIFHDFLTFEFNLFTKLNLSYFNFIESGHHLQTDKLLPRSRFFCIYRYVTNPHMVYLITPDGGMTAIADLFIALMSQTLIATINGTIGTTYVYEDCYYINDHNYNDPLSGYADIGSNWRDWSDFFEWYLNWWNSHGSGTPGGSGSGGNGNPPSPPPPTMVETCLAGNLALSASVDYMKQNLVSPCNPNEDIDQVVMNALESACDLAQGNMSLLMFRQKQKQEFHNVIGSQLGIDFGMLLSNGVTIEELIEALPNLSSCCGSDFDETCAFNEINWFYGESEGSDYFYDQAYWENPNLDFPDQDLPTWTDFDTYFSWTTKKDVLYTQIGGGVLAARIKYPLLTNNTCALRMSIALNKCGIVIPHIPGEEGTLRGDDGKYYFLNVVALNRWMQLTFEDPTTYIQFKSPQHDPIRHELFTSHKGMYTMIARDPDDFDAKGHADEYDGINCGYHCYFKDAIEVNLWILEY